jgi:hypothetical protein
MAIDERLAVADRQGKRRSWFSSPALGIAEGAKCLIAVAVPVRAAPLA